MPKCATLTWSEVRRCQSGRQCRCRHLAAAASGRTCDRAPITKHCEHLAAFLQLDSSTTQQLPQSPQDTRVVKKETLERKGHRINSCFPLIAECQVTGISELPRLPRLPRFYIVPKIPYGCLVGLSSPHAARNFPRLHGMDDLNFETLRHVLSMHTLTYSPMQ